MAIAIVFIVYDNLDADMNDHNVDNINELQVKILTLIGWRVYIRTNVQLSNGMLLSRICDKVLEDTNRWRLMIISDSELRQYLS